MNSRDRSADAHAHIRKVIPCLRPLLEAIGEVSLPAPVQEPVADSLARIVAGQMLSRSAARLIISRMEAAAERLGGCGIYSLPETELRMCGLSARKARTMGFIAELATNEPHRLEAWRTLPFESLIREVSQIWGLSDWSAAMLAIFYFGHTDVFPSTDGSIVRAIQLIRGETLGDLAHFDHRAAAPYRSYLAMTLWVALDGGYLKATSVSPAAQ
jgi:DNA-3-methyladenine glycosylase II